MARRTPRLARALVTAVAVSVALVAPATGAVAASSDAASWQAYPGGADTGRPYFEATVAPGASHAGVLVLRNLGAGEIRLALYGADASTAPDGAFVLREPEAGGRGLVGSWFEPAQSVVTVPADSEARVPFTIAVPADTPPGDYGGAVLSSLDTGSDAGARVVARVGVRTYLRVTGDLVPSVAVDEVEVARSAPWWNELTGDLTFRARVTNTGNTRVRIAADARSSSALGTRDGALTATATELWPGDTATVSGEIDGASSLVTADALVAVHPAVVDGDTATALPDVTAGTRLVVVPWTLAGLVLVAVAAVLVTRHARARPRTAQPTPAPPTIARPS